MRPKESIASVQQIQQMHNAQAQHLENSVKLVIYNYNLQQFQEFPHPR